MVCSSSSVRPMRSSIISFSQVEALIEVVAEHVLFERSGESVLLVCKPDEYGHRVGYHSVNVEGEHAGIYGR